MIVCDGRQSRRQSQKNDLNPYSPIEKFKLFAIHTWFHRDFNYLFFRMSNVNVRTESLEGNSIDSDAFHTPRSTLSILSNLSIVSQEALSNGLRAFLCFSFGLSMLTPWNTWITATPFFKTRLAGSPFADNFNNFFSLGYMSVYVLSLTYYFSFAN